MSAPSSINDPAGYPAGSPLERTEGMDNTGTGDAIPPPPPDNTPSKERDAYWRTHVYLGDSQRQLTWRAVLIGGILGGLLSVTGIYITLKTGWGLGLTTIATLGSYSVMNGLTQFSRDKNIWQVFRYALTGLALLGLAAIFYKFGEAFHPSVGGTPVPVVKVVCGLLMAGAVATFVFWPRLVRPFTLLENNCMGSTANAASASTGMTLVGSFGGLLLVSETNISNPHWLAVGSVVFFTALLGICLAVPLKRRMVNDEELPYPSPRAGAEMLKSLYADGRDGLLKARALFITLALGALVGLLRALPQISATFRESKALKFLADNASIPDVIFDNPVTVIKDHKLNGLHVEPSLMLTAVGLILGIRVALSMFVGSVILYFVLAPAMFHADQEALKNLTDPTHFKAAMLVRPDGSISPQSWGLWGGTALLLTSSFATLAFQWRTLARAFSGIFSKTQKTNDALADIEVPMSWAIIAGIPCSIGLVVALWLGFDMNPALGLAALGLSFVIAVVCARTAAETDVNPIGPMGKVTQLIYAKLPGASASASINLVSAGATSAAGGSAVDMLADFKCSYLLGANPRKVWIAQLFGVMFGIVCVVPAWMLIVPDKLTLETKFNAIPAQMWSTVAKFLTDPKAQFYYGALPLIVVCAVVGLLIPLAGHFLPKAAKWMPSPLGLGLALALPLTNSAAFIIGALTMLIWEKGHKKSAVFFGLIISSGLMSGEAVTSSLILLGTQIVHLVNG